MINVILMIAITTAISGLVYIYVATNPTQEANRPEASVIWDTDAFNDHIKITKTTPNDVTYAGSSTNPYLLFKSGDTLYYVYDNAGSLEIKDSADLEADQDAVTNLISAGDIISGFVEGVEYKGIWGPTNKLLDDITV